MADKYEIQMLKSAELDLEQIFYYIYHHDSPTKANHVLEQIYENVHKLDFMPHRGVYPPELYEIGITKYRQIYFKPYRIIYSIDDDANQVFIEYIIDGRRNIQPVLIERLTPDNYSCCSLKESYTD